MDHRRHVQLHHLLVERVPPLVGERRVLPVAARRVRVQVAADETELLHAALQLGDAVGRRHARRLRQLADADEVLGIERAAPVDQVVADLGPVQAGGRVAHVVRHAGRPRREDRDVGAPLALKLELRVLQRLPDLVVADAQGALRRHVRRVAQPGDLFLPVGVQRFRRSRVVPVTVDDHDVSLLEVQGVAGEHLLRGNRARQDLLVPSELDHGVQRLAIGSQAVGQRVLPYQLRRCARA